MNNLFAPLDAYKTYRLKVSIVHDLYVEESGNPKGHPVLFLHGGPGAYSTEDCRRFFDPQFYRIIIFDQRGCGKSLPLGLTETNTTWHIIQDIEKIREHLKIPKWMVFGGSWGATLALLYAQSCPKRVTSLVLRSIFLSRQQDIDWFYKKGANKVYPDIWEKFVKVVPPENRDDIVKHYFSIINSDDERSSVEAARLWNTWEDSILKLSNHQELEDEFLSQVVQEDIAAAKIQIYYLLNRCFLNEKTDIIKNIERVRHIPTTIVHGRFDAICPFDQAYELRKSFPEANLVAVEGSGHSAFDPGIVHELIKATEIFKKYNSFQTNQ